MPNRKLIIECCLCRDYKDQSTHRYYTPSSVERRNNHFAHVRISHSYCPECYIIQCEKDGFSKEELEKIVERTVTP